MIDSITGGWDKQDVALAQRDLVIVELQHPNDIPPFISFRWAMENVRANSNTLLDAGCGVGHYGVLCERYYQDIIYTGTDVSEFMIQEARKLSKHCRFEVCRFEDNQFDNFDVILAGGIIEVTSDPFSSLEMILGKARRYIILNRLRLTTEPSRQIEETTYCGYIGKFFEWNLNEIVDIINKHASIMAWRDYETQTTLVIEKGGNGSVPIYDGSARRKAGDYPEYNPYEIIYGIL